MSSSIRMRSGDMVISFGCSSAGDRRLPPKDAPDQVTAPPSHPALGEAVPSKTGVSAGTSRTARLRDKTFRRGPVSTPSQTTSGGIGSDHRPDARQPGFATRAIHHAYDPADHH